MLLVYFFYMIYYIEETLREHIYKQEDFIMDIYEQIELQDCPICGGAGLLEEECKSSFYVMCLDCGSHSVNIDFKSEDEKLSAAKRGAELWNTGKVISSHPGE